VDRFTDADRRRFAERQRQLDQAKAMQDAGIGDSIQP